MKNKNLLIRSEISDMQAAAALAHSLLKYFNIITPEHWDAVLDGNKIRREKTRLEEKKQD